MFKRFASVLLWSFAWAAFIYAAPLLSFAYFVPPQGIERSLYWHLFFGVRAVLIVAICTPFLRSSALGTTENAAKGGVTAFLISTVVSCVGCAVTHVGGETQAWLGIPLMSIIFFSTLSGVLIGALCPFGTSRQR